MLARWLNHENAASQIWAGSKQKQFQVGRLQLLHQYSPLAAAMLLLMVPVFEAMGWREAYA